MFDYIRGLHELKKWIPNEELQMYHTHEARLMDTLQKADLYGETPTSNAEKNAVVGQLNKLALKHCGRSFNDMCNDQLVSHTLLSPVGAAFPEKNILQQPHSARIAIELLAPVVPTAYCKNLDVADFPLLRVTIDTTDPLCGDARLQIHTWIEDYSDLEVKSITLPRGKTMQVMLFPLFKHEAIKKLNEVRLVTLHIQIKHIMPVQNEDYETKRIRLLAYNAALLALEMEDETVVDLSRYLAAWVTPHDQPVAAFLSTVARYHDEHKLEGYPHLDACDDPVAFVRKQVQATYEALKQDVKMVYVDTSFVIGNQNEQIVQRVKLPAETLVLGGNANCLDGTVLFASVLAAIGLQPLIMLERGHAYLGWKIFVRGEPVRYEFLETTLIDTADFVAAQQRGLERYRFALSNHWLEHEINDRDGYARIIDVIQCHEDGIHPLA